MAAVNSLVLLPAPVVPLLSLLVLPMVSCSFALDSDRVQCKVTADCHARGSGFATSSCENNYCVIDSGSGHPLTCERDLECTGVEVCSERSCVDPFDCEVPASSGAATVTMPVTNVFGEPLPNTPARLCRNIDPQCQTPIAELVADDQGVLAFELPAGFQGYLEFVVEGYFPQLQVLPTDPLDGAMLQAASLSPTDFIGGLALAVGAQPDPERGHLFLSLLSCLGPAANITISSSRSDEHSITFYVLDGVPSADLTATTREGTTGFLNFRGGNAAVTLTHNRTGQELTLLTFVIRAGFLTVARVQPEVQ